MNQKSITTHFLAFLAGVLITYILMDLANSSKLAPNPISRDDVMTTQDRQDLFLNSIQGMLKQQMESMDLPEKGFEDNLEILKSENSDNLEIKIKAGDINRDSINISIAGDRVNISGRIEKKTDNSFFVSSFEREVDLPSGYDTSAPQINNDSEFIVIKFLRKK